MGSFQNAIARAPLVGRILLIFPRAKVAFSYFREPLAHLLRWLFGSREITNFTYHLDESHERYLAALIAEVTSSSYRDCLAYIEEIKNDGELREHIVRATEQSDLAFIADREVRYGRRVGWYAFVRVMKPKIVIETGVDKGLGACVLTAALKRNNEEGHAGHYYGTDINPDAGYLLSGAYADHGNILCGDSIESLNQFEEPIDLFINDSDHSEDYEAREYLAVQEKLSEHAVVLGDNAHCSDKLFEFSLATNRHFLFFHEKPHKHWYPGGGIGVSFKRG